MLGWQCQEQVLMGPGCLTSAGENLSAWVRRSCLNLRKEKAGAGRESVRAQGRTGHLTRHTEDLPHHPLVSLWCPPWGTQDPHLLILVHHPLAAGVKHSESTQDGFLRVCPCGWRQPGELSDSQALGPTQEELILQGNL